MFFFWFTMTIDHAQFRLDEFKLQLKQLNSKYRRTGGSMDELIKPGPQENTFILQHSQVEHPQGHQVVSFGLLY